ncbi:MULTISPECIES: TetR/AcrR family transcriptional regulator [unclassified Frankia]|uniref:TetR/AcrR family transcriptional regulator n=1 Tax=unclassified Frankia TaxID=2632575 RepID=UPI0027DB110D|nr:MULTISPECIES: TetR/AcrR family transcriptional regulator [unclassified Frankia]
MEPDDEGDGPSPDRRRYDSPVRRGRAGVTRERILAAGSELVHRFPTWDWKGLTFRAVADRAGVSERTVYRHFATERELHDAVMRRLEEEAGLSYDGLRLDDLPELAGRVLDSLSSFEVWRGVTEYQQRQPFAPEDERRRGALLAAVTASAPAHWSDEQRLKAAALIDVVWNLPTFERLIAGWKLDTGQASDAVTWAIRLLVEAVRGRPPGTS